MWPFPLSRPRALPKALTWEPAWPEWLGGLLYRMGAQELSRGGAEEERAKEVGRSRAGPVLAKSFLVGLKQGAALSQGPGPLLIGCCGSPVFWRQALFQVQLASVESSSPAGQALFLFARPARASSGPPPCRLFGKAGLSTRLWSVLCIS